MTRRRTHSSVDTLPKATRDQLLAMVIDGTWPAGRTDPGTGKPSYDDMVTYLEQTGHPISRSAVGRWARRMLTIARMKEGAEIMTAAMGDITEENVGQRQKAVAEMITAHMATFLSENETIKPKDMMALGVTVRDMVNVSIKAEKFRTEQIDQKAVEADKKITDIAKKKKIDPEVLKQIREQVYGIVK